MDFDGDIRLIDVAPSHEILDFDYSTIQWTTGIRNFVAHPETYSLAFIETAIGLEHCNTDHPLYDLIVAESKKLEDKLEKTTVLATMLMVPSGKSNIAHVDIDLFKYTHRCHLAVQTSDEALMIVENNEYNFPKGKWIELNNMKTHQVVNNSDVDRIHIIIDLK